MKTNAWLTQHLRMSSPAKRLGALGIFAPCTRQTTSFISQKKPNLTYFHGRRKQSNRGFTPCCSHQGGCWDMRGEVWDAFRSVQKAESSRCSRKGNKKLQRRQMGTEWHTQGAISSMCLLEEGRGETRLFILKPVHTQHV